MRAQTKGALGEVEAATGNRGRRIIAVVAVASCILIAGIYAIVILPSRNGPATRGSQTTQGSTQGQCPGVSVRNDSAYHHVVDFFSFYQGPPAPIGISDYGIVYHSSPYPSERWSGYSLNTSEVVGNATIYSLSVNDPDLGSLRHTAQLQLNVVLRIATAHGNQSYWLQNVAIFETNETTVNFGDEIWNVTSRPSVLNSGRLTGVGGMYGNQSTGTYYGVLSRPMPGLSYVLPIRLEMITNVTKAYEGSTTIDFGYQVFNGSSLSVLGRTVYDRVSLGVDGMESAAIEVNGFEHAPEIYYNAELVFTGGPSTANVAFESMNSTIALQYVSIVEGHRCVASPISIWEFGTSGESVSNLQTSYVKGRGGVGIGRSGFYSDYLP